MSAVDAAIVYDPFEMGAPIKLSHQITLTAGASKTLTSTHQKQH